MTALRFRAKWSAIALGNLLRGLAYDPVARCRTCRHTHPYHYRTCPKRATR